MGKPELYLVGLFVAPLIAVLYTDLRWRRIPNRLVLGVALAAVPWWWLADMATPREVAIQLVQTGIVHLIFRFCWSRGWMGGGDVKLLTAIALWLPPGAFAYFLVVMAIMGGLVTMASLVMTRAAGRVRYVPYGVAIAGAGLWQAFRTIS